MKKILFAIIILAAALLCACGQSGSDQATRPPAVSSNLKNAVDWGIEGITLDEITDIREAGSVKTTYTMYPSAWPASELPQAVPEYTGTGWMYLLISSAAAGNAENRIAVTLSIYEYSDDELAAYGSGLIAADFGKTPESQYSADVKNALAAKMIDGYSRYASKTHAVQLIQNHDENGDFMQITVITFQ